MFDCLYRQQKCYHGNSKSINIWRLYKKWTHQHTTRNLSTILTSTDFGKSSLYLLHGIQISIAYRQLVSLATVVRVLEPREKVTHYVLQHSKKQVSCWNLKDRLLDTYSSLNLLQFYCIPEVVGIRWFASVRAMCSICGNSANFSIVQHDLILSSSNAS